MVVAGEEAVLLVLLLARPPLPLVLGVTLPLFDLLLDSGGGAGDESDVGVSL